MNTTQISVFLENKSGRLLYVTNILSQANVNIRALSVADTADFGILRMIVDKPQVAYEALKSNNMTVTITEVLAVVIPDVPGGLNNVMQIFADNDVNIEYLYAFIGKNHNKAIAIFRVSDLEKVAEILQQTELQVLSSEELMDM